jgi:hypothetical protein
MGRHSAPDDDDGVVMTFPAPVAGAPPVRGRHAQYDEEDEGIELLEASYDAQDVAEQDTIRLVPLEPAWRALDQPAPQQAVPLQPARPAVRRHHSTAADLALLREHSDVRARVIAALIAPFVLYTVVMYLLTAFDVYFIWLWIPLVGAGVLAGSFLDAAHRRHGQRT